MTPKQPSMAQANGADALIARMSEEVINNISSSLDQRVNAIDMSVNAICKKISSTEKKLDETEKLILDNIDSIAQLGN